jgi:hypothetical protein
VPSLVKILYESLEDVVMSARAVATDRIAVLVPCVGKTAALTAPASSTPPRRHCHLQQARPVDDHRGRPRARGAVWVFDPQAITHAPRTWWWNALTLTSTCEEACRFSFGLQPFRGCQRG